MSDVEYNSIHTFVTGRNCTYIIFGNKYDPAHYSVVFYPPMHTDIIGILSLTDYPTITVYDFS